MKSRDVSLDIMRILACLAVITIHTAGTGLMPGRDYPLLSFEWISCFVYRSLSGWAVPLFVMITGSIFLDPTKDLSISMLFKNNILKLLIVLIVWSAFYTYFCHGTFLPLGLASGHLWYLSMIIGLYFTIPVVRILPDKIKDYFIILWIIFLIYDFIAKCYNVTVLQEIEHYFFTGYIGYLLLGDWCRRNQHNAKLCVASIIIALILLILSICVSIYMSKLHNEITSPLIHYFSPVTVVVAVAVYFICGMLSNKLRRWNKLQYIISNISISTLGIYLIHMFLLIQAYTRVVRYIPNPLLFIPLIVVGVFVLGFLITIVLRRIPFVGKYIV
jgi:surface polysaccharide O-acyltransferase-like enzyme